MREWRRKRLLRTCIVYALCWTTAWLVFPNNTTAESEMPQGAKTSSEASPPGLENGHNGDFTLAGWEPSYAFLANVARADTTELEFPEEEEGSKHLIRDIGIFIVVSAFLAFFIVKVFIEEEEEEPPPDRPGKEPPFNAGFNQAPQPAW